MQKAQHFKKQFPNLLLLTPPLELMDGRGTQALRKKVILMWLPNTQKMSQELTQLPWFTSSPLYLKDGYLEPIRELPTFLTLIIILMNTHSDLTEGNQNQEGYFS